MDYDRNYRGRSGDTPMTLYHDKLVPVGVHCLMAAVAAIAANCAAETPQGGTP